MGWSGGNGDGSSSSGIGSLQVLEILRMPADMCSEQVVAADLSQDMVTELEQRSVKLEMENLEGDSVLESVRNAHQQLRDPFTVTEASLLVEKERMASDVGWSERQREDYIRKLQHLESELEASVIQAAVMKTRLVECERLLVEEATAKAMAESSLADARRQEEHLLKIKQAHEEDQEKLRWKSERFQSLEEAHSKLKKQREEQTRAWETERSELCAGMESLQAELESKKRSQKEAEAELRRMHQALATEENRRKVLKGRVTESDVNLQKVSAEFKAAQSEAEHLRVKANLEMGSLRDALSWKERQVKDLQTKQQQLEMEKEEAEGMRLELAMAKEERDQSQKASDRLDQELCVVRQAHERSLQNWAEQERAWEAEKDKMLKDLSSCEGSSASSRRERQDLMGELERSRMLAERIGCSHKELVRKVEELEKGLENAETRSRDADMALDSLQRKSTEDVRVLQEQLAVKDKKWRDAEEQVKQHQLAANDLTSKCVKLEEESRAYTIQAEELKAKKDQLVAVKESRDKMRVHVDQLQRKCREDTEKIMDSLEEANSKVSAKEELLKELQAEVERSRCLISDLNTRLAQAESQKGLESQELEKTYEELSQLKRSFQILTSASQAEKEALLETLHCKDQKLLDFKLHTADLEKKVAELSTQHEQFLELKRELENLQHQTNQRTLQRNDFEKERNFLLDQLGEERSAWNQDRETLMSDLSEYQEKLKERDDQLMNLKSDLDRKAESKSKLDAECGVLKKQLDECSSQLQEATQQIHASKREIEVMCKEAQMLIQSRNDIAIAKETKIEQLRKRVTELEMRCEEMDREADNQSSKISSLELLLQDSARFQLQTEERLRAASTSLSERDDELKKALNSNDELHKELMQCQELSDSMQLKLHQQMLDMREQSSASHQNLKSVKEQLGQSILEKESLQKEIDLKAMALDESLKKNQNLLDTNASLENSVKILREKILHHIQEAGEYQASIEQLCGNLEKSESQLVSQDQTIKDLQSKIEVADLMHQQLKAKESKLLTLEETLEETRAAVQDKEEKMAASEWAVQQLAKEISRAKAGITQKEKEEAILRERLAEAERKLREKEGELMELQRYNKRVSKENKARQAESEKANHELSKMRKQASAWQEQEASLNSRSSRLAYDLEEKEAAITDLDTEVRRRREVQQVMEGAIESLKLQVANEQKLCSAQKSEMDQLCRELEEVSSDRESTKQQLKELQLKLEQMEQSLESQVLKLQQEKSDLSQDLALCRSKLQQLEEANRILTEESSSSRSENETVKKLIAAKDKSFADIEKRLLDKQNEFRDQATLAQQTNAELEATKQQVVELAEKHSALDADLTQLQCQSMALQIGQQQLELEKERLMEELEASHSRIATKDKELQHLCHQVEQLQILSSKQEESDDMIARLTAELQTKTQSYSDQISSFSLSLSTAQAEVRSLQAKESALQALEQTLALVESQKSEYEAQISKTGDELSRTQSDLEKERKNLLSSSLQIEELEKDNREIRSVASSAVENQEILKAEIEAGHRAMHELNGQLEEQIDARLSVEALNQRLQNDIKKAMTDLQNEKCKGELSVIAVASLQKTADESQMKVSVVIEENQALQNEVGTLNAVMDELRSELEAHQKSQRSLEEESKRLAVDLEKDRSDLDIEKRRSQSLLLEIEALKSELLKSKMRADAATLEQHAILQEKELAHSTIREMEAEIRMQKERQNELEAVNENLMERFKEVEHELNGQKKEAQSACIALEDLKKEMIEERAKLKSAIEENHIIKRDVNAAYNLIRQLRNEIEMRKAKQESLEEANKKLQTDLASAEEEALARKSKLQNLSSVLEKSQASSRDLKARFEMLRKNLLQEGGNDPFYRFNDKFDLLLRASNPGKQIDTSLSEVDQAENLDMQKCGNTDKQLAHSKQLEKQIALLRIEKEETRQEMQRLADELEGALSKVAGKIKTIEQLNEELDKMKSLVKKREQRACPCACDTMNKKARTDTSYKDENDDEPEPVVSKEEYNHYLELCDSLLRKNIGLERQTETLQRKNQKLLQQMQRLQQNPNGLLCESCKQPFHESKDTCPNENTSPEKDSWNIAKRRATDSTPQSRMPQPIADLSKAKTPWESEHPAQSICERKPLHLIQQHQTQALPVLQISKRARSNDAKNYDF